MNQFQFAMAVVAATPGMGAGQGQTWPPGLPMAEVTVTFVLYYGSHSVSACSLSLPLVMLSC